MTQEMWETQRTYDKPDASVCKVWVCRNGWYAHYTTDHYGVWWQRVVYADGSVVGKPQAAPQAAPQANLPLGPWRPCYVVGQELEPRNKDRVFASTGAEHSSKSPGNVVVGITAHCQCGHVFCDDVYACAPNPPKESVAAAERAVLEAADELQKYQGGVLRAIGITSPAGYAAIDLQKSVDALRAARQPKKAERFATVAVEVDHGGVLWATQVVHDMVLMADVCEAVRINRIARVLPEAEHAEPWRECDRALAKRITRAME